MEQQVESNTKLERSVDSDGQDPDAQNLVYAVTGPEKVTTPSERAVLKKAIYVTLVAMPACHMKYLKQPYKIASCQNCLFRLISFLLYTFNTWQKGSYDVGLSALYWWGGYS